LSEAEGLCEDVAMIDAGRIIARGNIDALLQEHKQENLEALFINLTGKELRD
jgi:ABC-2 type transport system ATP-binding protein